MTWAGAGQGRSGDRWPLRTVSDELSRRYRSDGWWNDATLGELVADGLGRTGATPFRVRSAVQPWEGTFAEVDRSARALAGALRAEGVGPGDVVAFQLPNWVEAGITFWAAAYLGAVVVPIVHFYGAKEVDYILRTVSPDVMVTADRFGHNDYLTTYEGLLSGAPARWLVVGGAPDRRASRRGEAIGHPARRRSGRRPARGRSGRAGHHRLHLGHHPGPEGGDPLAPHHRVRDPPARLHVPHGRAAPDHRGPGRPLHRDAQRLPDPAAPGQPGEPDRRLGPGRGAPDDARGRLSDGRRGDLLPHQPARPPRLHPRAPGPHAVRRARRLARARGGDPAGHRPRDEGVPLLREHRAPVDHRMPARRPRGQAAHHRRPGPARRRDPPRRRTARSSAAGPTASSATPTRR